MYQGPQPYCFQADAFEEREKQDVSFAGLHGRIHGRSSKASAWKRYGSQLRH